VTYVPGRQPETKADGKALLEFERARMKMARQFAELVRRGLIVEQEPEEPK